MSFFGKLFGNKNPLDSLRRAVQQKRWADALVFSEDITPDRLPPTALEEFHALQTAAGDALAQMNLEEAEACRRSGDLDRAAEHFALASRQARSEPLQQRISASLQDTAPPPILATPSAASSHDCHSSCTSGCTPATTAAQPNTPANDLDTQTRWDLMLATYPADLAARYEGRGQGFQLAVLAAHDGDDQTALKLFEQVPETKRDDLFYFERGSLHAQRGEKALARTDFAKAVELNSDLLPALDALLTLELEHGWSEEAELRLQQLLATGEAPVLCYERLALLRYRKGDLQGAAELGQQALVKGSSEPQTILLTAHLLEAAGNLQGAEAVLQRLQGGGCGGGGPVALAEFWLRHNRQLDKALESFKSAFRQENDNPRWALRIGQVYLAKGWKKEGLPLVQAALKDPKLGPDLQQEAEADLTRAMGH